MDFESYFFLNSIGYKTLLFLIPKGFFFVLFLFGALSDPKMCWFMNFIGSELCWLQISFSSRTLPFPFRTLLFPDLFCGTLLVLELCLLKKTQLDLKNCWLFRISVASIIFVYITCRTNKVPDFLLFVKIYGTAQLPEHRCSFLSCAWTWCFP